MVVAVVVPVCTPQEGPVGRVFTSPGPTVQPEITTIPPTLSLVSVVAVVAVPAAAPLDALRESRKERQGVPMPTTTRPKVALQDQTAPVVRPVSLQRL